VDATVSCELSGTTLLSLFNIELTILLLFIGTRFNDISVAIRTKCVQYSMHFLLNHPELRRDITETLKMRQHDSEENVRYEVVMAIVTTARRDFEVVSDSEDLLEFVKERTLDKKVNILSYLVKCCVRRLPAR